MGNLINDKLFPVDNIQFTPEEEFVLRAYMMGKVGKFTIQWQDDGSTKEFTFIKGQTFEQMIDIATANSKIGAVYGLLMVENGCIIADPYYEGHFGWILRDLNGRQITADALVEDSGDYAIVEQER